MDSMAVSLLYWAFGLFIVGAVGGLMMATLIFRGRTLSVPPLLAVAHGTMGALGMTLLLAVILTYDHEVPDTLKYSLGAFVTAACFGVFLVSFHLRKKPHPVPVIPVHALLAVTGLGLLLWTLARTAG